MVMHDISAEDLAFYRQVQNFFEENGRTLIVSSCAAAFDLERGDILLTHKHCMLYEFIHLLKKKFGKDVQKRFDSVGILGGEEVTHGKPCWTRGWYDYLLEQYYIGHEQEIDAEARALVVQVDALMKAETDV